MTGTNARAFALMAGALERGLVGGLIEGRRLAAGQLVALRGCVALTAENLGVVEVVAPVAAQMVDVKICSPRASSGCLSHPATPFQAMPIYKSVMS